MFKRFVRILNTKNARTSAIFYFGSFATSIGNYLFHLLLMRTLAPEAYGEFLSYLSFLYLITIPAGTLVTIVSKYAADFYGRNDDTRLNRFFYLVLQKVFIPALVLSVLVIVFSPLLAEPLKAQKLAFIILGIDIIISFLSAILNSYLMAMQQYVFKIFMAGVHVVLKISLAYWLIKLGFGATGGVIALLLASVIGLSIVWWKVKPVVYPRLSKKVKFNINLKSFSVYSLILAAGSLSLISIDVLMVRYFFSEYESGIFSALSVLGRMIYFGLAPLSVLILPMVSKKFASGEKTKMVWWKLAGVTFLFGAVGVSIFALVPETIVRLLSGVQYVDGSGLLWIFASGMWMFSISRLLLAYFMGVGLEKSNWVLLLAMILQPLLIFVNHKSLESVAMINLLTQVFLLTGLMIYYKVGTREIR